MKEPEEVFDWQTGFKDLPDIPECKRWRGDELPLDHISLFKLFNREKLTQEDERILNEACDYYDRLYEALPFVDYSKFEEEDFKNFKNYILYAFNYTTVGGNDLTVFSTYRMVLNEKVSEGRNIRITNRDQLTFPSLEIVKKHNLYNRANTPKTTVFYSSENIDTTLKECRPPLSKLVTVGVWKTKINRRQELKKLVAYQISDGERAFNHNKGLRNATLAANRINEFSALGG